MVETKLLTNKHTQPWSDSIINETTAPPPWILDLSLASSKSNVESVVGDFAYSPPFEPLTLDDNFHIACLFLRYKRRELSWATFLYEAGQFADAADATPECEFWYSLLNQTEASNFNLSLETRQVSEVRPQIQLAILDATHCSQLVLG